MLKVIIADDEIKVCQLIRELVDWKALGLTVAGIANDGLSALEMISLHQPDFLITDIRMPGVDGIELIRRAKETLPRLQCVIISGYRHFDYAHNAIRYGVEDYLLKPLNQQEFVATLQKLIAKKQQELQADSQATDLKKQVSESHERLQADFVLRLLHDSDSALTNLTPNEVSSRSGIALPEGSYTCLAVKPDLEGVPPQDGLWHVVTEKALSHTRLLLAPLSKMLLLCPAPEGVLCVLAHNTVSREEILRRLKELMEELYLLRDLFPSLEITVGVSPLAQTPNALSTAMKQAYQALCRRMLEGTGQIYTAAAPRLSSNIRETVLGGESRKGLLAALEILDEASYHIQLEKVIHSFHALSGISVPDFYDCFRELILLHFFGLSGNTAAGETVDAMLQEYDACWNTATTVKKAEADLISLLCSHLNTINTRRSDAETKPIRQAKKYMQDNFHKPLTLEDVSDIAGFNPAYFSTLFKKVTGENFLEYLSSLRMKEAKELLMDSRLSVPDIGEKVGYSDSKYFVKLFKKTTGLTPQEYRKLYC